MEDMINVFDTQDGNAPISFAADKEQPAAETTHKPAAEQPVHRPAIDFGPVEDKTHGLIKVVGVGGGGCNAVRNMYDEGIVDVNFAVCNTDSKSLSRSPIPVKLPIGSLGAGGNPEEGRKAAQSHLEEIKQLFTDGTQMVFVTAGMGGGTGTGAAPVVAGVAKSMGLLTIGIVTIPFYFEKKRKIVKALKGVEEMRKNVDAILIVNNERICDIYADSDITVKESFRRADQILCNATKSISELITIEGDINLDFKDVESTMRSGGGAIMAMGRASGERRVEKAIVDALDSPLLYGNDISKAKRILFNIYTSEKSPLHVNEMNEIDAFMDALNPDIDVIWGVSEDNTLEDDAKVTILATGFDDGFGSKLYNEESRSHEEEYYSALISKLYKPLKKNNWIFLSQAKQPVGEQPDAGQSVGEHPYSERLDTERPSAGQPAVEQPVAGHEATTEPDSFSSSSAATASDDIYNNVDEEDREDKNDKANTYNKEGDAHDSSSSTAPSDETNVSENYPSTNTEQTNGSAFAASADGSAHGASANGSAFAASADGSAYGASSHDNEPSSAAQSSTSNADVADRQRTTWGKSLLGKLKQRLEDMGLLEDMNNPTE